MPVDPDIQAMLDRLNAGPKERLTLHQARALYVRQYLEMSLPPGGDVAEQRISIPGAHPDTALTLYRPAGLHPGAPVILYLHGGGFVLGDAEAYSRQSARIALETGAVVAFLDYRRSPEHRFPAALEDTVLAVRWIAGNAASFGTDPARFAIAGDSAGGNLAIAAMLHHRGDGLLRCVGLLYPVTDLRPYLGLAPLSASDEAFAAGFYLELAEMGYFGRSYLSDPQMAADPRISPLAADDLGGLPPVLIHAAEFDVLRDQGEAFAHRLQAAGNTVRYIRHDGLIHNFMQMAGISRRADQAFRQVCRALREALAAG